VNKRWARTHKQFPRSSLYRNSILQRNTLPLAQKYELPSNAF
jgi:hypothetical protein